MFEEINKRREAVQNNIMKSFGLEVEEEAVEKSEKELIEKGKWNVGDTFTRHGITYKCTGFSVGTGRPTWSKVKDSDGGSKQEDSKEKKSNQEQEKKNKSEGIIKNIRKLINKYNELGYNEKYREFDIKPTTNMRGGYDGIVILGVSKKFIDDNRFHDYAKKLGFSFIRYAAERFSGDYRAYYDYDVQKEPEKQKSSKQKLSDLGVGDEVVLIKTDYDKDGNEFVVSKKKKKIEKVGNASFIIDGERYLKRTGKSVGDLRNTIYSVSEFEDKDK